LKHLLEQNGYELINADFNFAQDFSGIETLIITVRTHKKTENRRPFIRIEPVRIGNQPLNEDDAETSAVKKLLAEFYSLPVTHIHVFMND
jgi:hypothetical protein